MLFTSSLFAVVLLLAGDASAAPTVEKRYTNTVIRSGRTNTCLTFPAGQKAANGTPLTVGDCATAIRWDINPGSGSVIVSGTNFALDAGIDPHNNVPAKVWQSYPGSTQQTWFLTGDNRIAITGGNQCLDEGDNGPQTYQCTPGNTNQVWYVGGVTPPPSSTSKPPPPPSSSSAPPASSSAAPPPPAGKQIKWNKNQSLCATVQGTPGNGAPVNMMNCANPTSPDAKAQLWVKNGGNIQLAGSNFCLDAGSNPANGITMKVWQCYQGAPQQTFVSPGSGSGLFQTANTQCLDVDAANSGHLQTWYCSQPDPQQQFLFA